MAVDAYVGILPVPRRGSETLILMSRARSHSSQRRGGYKPCVPRCDGSGFETFIVELPIWPMLALVANSAMGQTALCSRLSLESRLHFRGIRKAVWITVRCPARPFTRAIAQLTFLQARGFGR